MIRRFTIYGLAGWCMEIIFTGIYSLYIGDPKLSGSTYIWMFFIYGLAVFLEPIHDRMRKMPIIVRGGVYAVVILFAEYFTGMALSKLIGGCPWNYGQGRYAINGITRLDYAPLWGSAGILFEKLHDTLVDPEISKEPGKE